jgi:cytoskeletal protein CcmA (bactofilin family)
MAADFHRKTKVVDGFSAIQAAARARKEKPPGAPPAPAAAPSRAPAEAGRATRIGHTALPTRYEINCYECGFSFHLTGRTQGTYCPKCRQLIEIVDYTIESEWTDALKTAGRIHLAATGVVKSGELVGCDVLLNGRVDGGSLRAYRWLEIGPGAAFAPERVTGQDLRVAAGATVATRDSLSFRHVEVSGVLKARLTATGQVVIKPGGLLQGELRAAHLTVEEGGGLKAKLRVEPAAAEEELPLRKTA